MATKQTVEELQAQVESLQKKLDVETKARTSAEEMAMSVAQAGQYIGHTEEQPSGNTVKINKCANPWVKDEKEQKWVEIDVPTYFYNIQLPAGAGVSLSTNGVEYYHGQTYEVDMYTLADLKSRVARCWEHEKQIHSDNENAYRKPTNTHLMTAAARNRGAH